MYAETQGRRDTGSFAKLIVLGRILKLSLSVVRCKMHFASLLRYVKVANDPASLRLCVQVVLLFFRNKIIIFGTWLTTKEILIYQVGGLFVFIFGLRSSILNFVYFL